MSDASGALRCSAKIAARAQTGDKGHPDDSPPYLETPASELIEGIAKGRRVVAEASDAEHDRGRYRRDGQDTHREPGGEVDRQAGRQRGPAIEPVAHGRSKGQERPADGLDRVCDDARTEVSVTAVVSPRLRAQLLPCRAIHDHALHDGP